MLPAMSVVDNVMLGQERSRRGRLDRSEQRDLARDALARVGLGELDLDAPAEALTLGEPAARGDRARARARHARADPRRADRGAGGREAAGDLRRRARADRARRRGALHQPPPARRSRRWPTRSACSATAGWCRAGPAASTTSPRLVREMVGRDVDTVFPEPARRRRARAAGARSVPAGARRRRPRPERARGRDRRGRRHARLGPQPAAAHARRACTRAAAGEVTRRRSRGRARPCATRCAPGVVFVPEERKTEGLVLPLAGAGEHDARRPARDRAARLAVARARARGVRGGARAAVDPRERARTRAPGSSRAATSRRSCWRSGCGRGRACCCSTSRRAASTSAPRPRSTG